MNQRSAILCPKFPTSLVFSMLLFAISRVEVNAQIQVKGEAATANLKVNEKSVALKANTAGYFQRISNISRNANIPVEISYPNGNAGEKVVLAVLDGGKIDGVETVKVVLLNKEKKCLFNFQVTDQSGLFRIMVYKGGDEKVVQLWVGPELKPVLQ